MEVLRNVTEISDTIASNPVAFRTSSLPNVQRYIYNNQLRII